MARRRDRAEIASLSLSGATDAAVAAEVGRSPERIAQIRRAEGDVRRPGRRRSATSRDSLAALGTRASFLAALASVTPDELITAGWEALTTEEQRALLSDDHDNITRSHR